MFFDRPESGELAILVHIDFDFEAQRDDPREFEELSLSAGADPIDLITGQRHKPDPKYFVGSGKMEEIRAAVERHGAELVLFNHSLSPSQERNLEKVFQCRVLDRTGLILDIFAQRARTHEGKLQVELAQLEHMSTRLVRGWTHLERQKGGIGLRGPGETQLETDRRLLRERIKSITKRLDKVHKVRQLGRRARKRAETPVVSIVGYTNAGKSTLFNRITQSDVYEADQLFATLDPTMRRISLPSAGTAILADTVGFIRHLPHKLVESFRATLEEAAEADLLLHVIDCAAEERLDNIDEVNKVLAEIDAGDIPTLEVYNKIDLMPDQLPRIELGAEGRPVRVWVSARDGRGLDKLIEAISLSLGDHKLEGDIVLTPAQGAIRARLFRHEAVLDESYDEQGNTVLRLRISAEDLKRLAAGDYPLEQLEWWSDPALES